MNKAVKIDHIPHVRYDEDGNVIERYDVEFPRFSDENNIYITDDWIRDRAMHGHKGDVSKADYSGIGKTVWYRCDDAPDREIIGMEMRHCGTSFEVKLLHTNGGYSIVAVPVK